MKTDTLNRKLRFEPPVPGGPIILQEADYLIFEAIDRHGPLPTPYLYRFTRHLRKDYTGHQKRLTELFNGDEGGSYLERPVAQFNSAHARYQHLAYKLSQRGRMALADRGTLGSYRPTITNSFPHDLLTACAGASIELACIELGIRYISREEILANPACPAETKDATNPMALPLPDGRKLIPDDLFGFQYPNGQYRWFVLEADRATESMERDERALEQTSFGKKLEQYAHVLSNKTFHARWGIRNLTILTLTTNYTRLRSILDCATRKVEARYLERFAVAVEPTFGMQWRVPTGLLSYLLTEPWKTAGGEKDIATP